MAENTAAQQTVKGEKKEQKISFKDYLDQKQKAEAKKPFQLPLAVKIILAIPLLPLVLFAILFIPITVYKFIMGMIVPQ